jgi:hypothetical protein
MGMIMENFRRYQEVVEAECGPSDNVIYLFESNQKVPTTTTVDELREQNNSGKISDEEYVRIWGESFDYEAKEVDRLYEQYLLQEQDEEVEVAGEEEETVEAPGWLRKLGQLFNKALDFLKDLWKKGLALLGSGLDKVLDFVGRFKEKYPILYKIIIYAAIALIAMAILYVVFKWLQTVMEDPMVTPGEGLPPLCAQAAAAATMQEAVGQCLVAGQLLTEGEYRVALGHLERAKVRYPESAELIDRSKGALTQCYDSARAGENVNIEDLLAGASGEAGVVTEAAKFAHELSLERGQLQTIQDYSPRYDPEALPQVKPRYPSSGDADERVARDFFDKLREEGDELDQRIQRMGDRLGGRVQHTAAYWEQPEWQNLGDEEALTAIRRIMTQGDNTKLARAVMTLKRLKPELADQLDAITTGG